MHSQPLTAPWAGNQLAWPIARNIRQNAGYLVLVTLPFVATLGLDMQQKTAYAAFLSVFNTMAIMLFYLQFPLGGRIKRLAPFANINWSMLQHRKVGQWLGLIFLLHPLLILAPRFLLSFDDGVASLVTTLQAPQMLTGIIAWLLMLGLVFVSILRDRLPVSYELWRVTHLLGFVAVAILATMHVTSVGSHGQFEAEFNTLWWGLCALSVGVVVFNHGVKPVLNKARPFRLVGIEPLSSRDWQMTLEQQAGAAFDFQPGQFVWINTEASGEVRDHPFSIASARASLPRVSFIIRNLGDYSSRLDELQIGQQVYVDGPYGSLSLDDADQAAAIVLIAGGAGIGPMVSLLRGLAERKDPRPLRLIYGNNQIDQMVLLQELRALETEMPDFRLQLVCDAAGEHKDVYRGVIDQAVIQRVMGERDQSHWAVYLCGPQPMVAAVTKSLQRLRVPRGQIHYEQLSF